MIFKSYELNKINLSLNKIFLFFGKNEGLKNEALSIIVKNKDTLLYDEFEFKCSVGKKGITSIKKVGRCRG